MASVYGATKRKKHMDRRKLPKSEEHKRKLSDAQKGRSLTAEHRAKLRGSRPTAIPWNKGKAGYSVHSVESRRVLSRRLRGNKHGVGKRPWNKGLAGYNAGSASSAWKGGVTPIHQTIRHSLEYRLWREAVFARDNYTCIWCGDNRGHNLEADHIKPFCNYPELRFAIDNGRTLCHDCHKKTGTYGRKAMNQ